MTSHKSEFRGYRFQIRETENSILFMVDLQRASAGSGKTYALTKYFIRFLIAVKDEDGRYRLRKSAEIPTALGQILAITFTNKATNEMQMRIVDKLDALARYQSGTEPNDWPDYMRDFIDELGVRPEEVRDAAMVALKTLLNNYSDFNVSTIDAFFQSVLRTFAYESNLADSYQVELESGYVSRMGLNSVLDDADSDISDRDVRETRRWLKLIVDSEPGHRWNVFQKSESGKKWIATPYSSLLGRFSNIDSEDYREKREELDVYLDSDVDLYALYSNIEKYFRSLRVKAFDVLAQEARKLEGMIVSQEYREGRGDVGKPYKAAHKILTECRWDKVVKVTFPSDRNWNGAPITKASKQDPVLWHDIKEQTQKVQEAYQEWDRTFSDPWPRLWKSLRVSFPFLGLLKAVSRKRREYLAENESIELGETSLILNTIIGPSDTPFVYERMGNYLSHLLVDEFQDTSSLQWKNLRPLVMESLANGNDNLIIGDAKQSIYRFRNADYELINSKVPEELHGSVNIKGNTVRENTNWRSGRRIVEWNNNLFHYIVWHIQDVTDRSDDAKEVMARKFRSLYSDVRQAIHKKERGYVELILRGKPGKDAQDRPEVEQQALGLILDALDRGYEARDICILARDNTSCSTMVQTLMDYNMEHPGSEPLQFVNEQSLLVGNSMAVRQVEIVLRTLVRGINPEVRDEETRRLHGAGNIHELESHLLLYRQMHPELSMARCMENFMNEDVDLGTIRDMLGRMQSLALPALVEAVICNFVTEGVREAGAPYLAAFQDILLEYCDSHPADLPSFLNWWDRVKEARAISSPEDANAIRIMTSHKSKGLEFPVVIVTNPLSSGTRIGDSVSGKEWVWVDKVDLKINDKQTEAQFPPYIPVNITSALEGTALEDILYRNYELETIDSLNLLYVTFTRAKDELYIFATQPDREAKGSESVYDLLTDFVRYESECPENPEKDFDPGVLLVRQDEAAAVTTVSYGEKPEEKFVERKDVKDEDRGKDQTAPVKEELTDYPSVMVGDKIKMRQVSLPDYDDRPAEEVDTDDEDIRNPRSVGNVCHAVMEGVETFADLPREIRRVEVSGIVPEDSEYLDDLLTHVAPGENADVDRWFGGEAVRVVSERAVLLSDERLRRPDRIMFYADGHVEIIDYKFGHRTAESDSRYRPQVRRYVSMLRQAGYTDVSGWLWYVFDPDPGRRVVKVC